MDRPLLQALIYSLIFHLMLFGTFRIRLSDFQDHTPQMRPLDVAIDSEKIEVSNDQEIPADKSALFLANLDPEEHMKMNIALLQDDPDSDEDALQRVSPKLTWAPKMYPLKLKVSNSLKTLTLVDDGSSLFREKRANETLARFVLAAHHFTIEYNVFVDGATGDIMRFERKDELLDKRLQAVADRIITQIKFLPFREKQRNGNITLSFCCTGEEIKGFLND
ncbi:MAG: hypothetical protein JSR37_03430 [Verrucomicrobia bacterium]|nr:hypothetical protein [Verrucomicrobiota bacterium]MBS0637226.1 hypothetical protein [Verrucomicrobiota bacterium]